MKTRILFTIPNFITAGSGGAMLQIIRRLDRDRFEPAVCVSRKGGKLDQEVGKLGIPFLETPFTVPAQPYATLPARAWAASRVFRSHRFAVWHSFHYSDDYTEPLIARLAGARHWIFTKKNMNWRQRAWYLRSLFASRIAAQNTDMMRDFFASPVFAYKTRLVPRGVDAARFRPDTPARLGLRSALGLADKLVVGHVAHLVPVKGHATLIEAISELPDTVLLLAGKPLDPAYTASLHSLVARLGLRERVRFLGDVEDVAALLAEVDVACLPTLAKFRQEGCPVALLEAMASARACVASDIPGARDLVVHRQHGLLVPPDNVAALRAALGELADAPTRARLGAAARERVLDHYTIDREAAAHMALYDELGHG